MTCSTPKPDTDTFNLVQTSFVVAYQVYITSVPTIHSKKNGPPIYHLGKMSKYDERLRFYGFHGKPHWYAII